MVSMRMYEALRNDQKTAWEAVVLPLNYARDGAQNSQRPRARARRHGALIQPWLAARSGTGSACESRARVTSDAGRLLEVLVEHEREPYAGDQKLTLNDVQRLAVPLDVGVIEIGAILETVERDGICQGVRIVAPRQPRLAICRLDLAAPFESRDVAQYVLGELLGVSPVREFLD